MSSSDALRSANTSTSTDKKFGVWAALTSFFLMWAFLYIVLVVFSPNWVCCAPKPNCDGVTLGPKDELIFDQGRAFVVALIVTLVVMLIVWLVSATASSTRSSE